MVPLFSICPGKGSVLLGCYVMSAVLLPVCQRACKKLFWATLNNFFFLIAQLYNSEKYRLILEY